MFSVLKGPVLTEKSTTMREQSRKVVVEVALDANKHQIKAAAEKLFNVKVNDVHTQVMRGKNKRVGKSQGRQSNFKKAVLTVAAGADLDVFGVQLGAATPEAQG